MSLDKKYFFLLGGHDLEMLTIKALLLDHGFIEAEDFLDNELAWGAKLSDYKGQFSEDRTNVCIELMEDVKPPKNYLRIDHHNDWNHKPSTLHQLAELLDIKLNRHQKLVAANDVAHIPGMEALNATKEEITSIRQQDRSAQGVTAEDEKLAILSIEKHLKQQGDVTVVYALTDKFSAITDRLYPCSKLLIYTEEELTYYGVGKKELVKQFAKEVENGTAYFGGSENGYFGIGKGKLSKNEIEQTLKKIINYVRETD